MENKPIVLKMIPQMNYYDNVVHTLVDMITNPLNKAVFITLYRCSKYSTITNALIKASENMKIPVFVYVETKAAGMKKENKELAKYLKEHGCHVISSVKEIKNENLRNRISKIHFKACINCAGEASSIFFSTGNFSVPQGVNTEDICTHISVNDHPIMMQLFRSMCKRFHEIFYDNFKSEFTFDYAISKFDISQKDLNTQYTFDDMMLKYDMVRKYLNRQLMIRYGYPPKPIKPYLYIAISNVYSVRDYWSLLLTSTLGSCIMDKSRKAHIRIKTRNIIGDYLRTFCEALKKHNIEFIIEILVRDHVGDKVRELIREKKYNINIYSGKLSNGYNWHACYAIVNNYVILTSCDTDDWKDRYEMALITNSYEVMNGEKNHLYDTYLLQHDFDKELHGFTWKIE